MKIAVLSDGAWGTALALTLIENNHKVSLWGPFPDYIEEMKSKGENFRFLPGIKLPDSLYLSADMAEVVNDANIIILASPVQYARSVIEKLTKFYNNKEQIILNVAKGIENGTLKRISEICTELMGSVQYAALSGPSHAEEVAKKAATAVVVASNNIETAKIIQKTFMNEFFRVYTSNDTLGIELGGALKNVYAIAAGIIDGMKLGDNAKAALITRAIAEMARLGQALGGRQETFSGLSGIGDMIVTCTSSFSRNRHVGEELGRGKTLDAILNSMGMVVAEGVKTTLSAYQISSKIDIETPIIDEIYAGLYENKNPIAGVKDLMTRKPKNEID